MAVPRGTRIQSAVNIFEEASAGMVHQLAAASGRVVRRASGL